MALQRSAGRGSSPAAARGDNVGFRIVMELDGDDVAPVDDQLIDASLVSEARQHDFARLLEENNFPLPAIRMYMDVIRRNPTASPDALVRKKLGEARERVIRLVKHLAPEQLNESMTVELEGILDKWNDDLDASNVHSSSVATYLDAGLAYEKLGREKKALTALVGGLDEDQTHWPQDPQFLVTVLLKLYSLSLAMEKHEDLQSADVAMDKCRELAELSLTQPKDARNRAWVFARSAKLKEQRGDLKAVHEFAAIAIRVPFPLNDEGWLKKDGLAMYGAVSDATIRLVQMEQQDAAAILEGYQRRVELAQRLANVVNDAASWLRLAQVLIYKADWHDRRDQQETRLSTCRQALKAAQTLTSKQSNRENLVWLANAHKYLGAALLSLEKYDEAQAEYDSRLAIQSKIDDMGEDAESLDQLLDAYRKLAALQSDKGDAVKSVQYIRTAIDAFEARRERLADDVAATKRSGLDLTLSWYQLLAETPQAAVTTARNGLDRNPDYKSLAINLLHGLLLQGKLEEARSLLEENRDVKLHGGEKAFTDVLLDDFAALRKLGIDHPGMATIEDLIRSWSKPKTNISP